MAKKKNKRDEICINRAIIKDLMISATVEPSLIADYAHITHVLLSAIDLICLYDTLVTYHLERKIEKLSLSHSIPELTESDFILIEKDDALESSEKNNRIEYIDSLFEKGASMMQKLTHLINVELVEIYKNHPEIDDDVFCNIRECCISLLTIVADYFNYTVTINQSTS